MLPKTVIEISNGGVYAQSVRCGKSNCRCAKGELHKGLYYYFTRFNGKLRKVYVPKRFVNELAALVEAARVRQANDRSIIARNREAMRTMGDLLRERDNRSGEKKGGGELDGRKEKHFR